MMIGRPLNRRRVHQRGRLAVGELKLIAGTANPELAQLISTRSACP